MIVVEFQKKILKRINTRKYGYCAEKVHENLCLIFGTEPAKTILAETAMVKDIVDLMESDYDKENLKFQIPDGFDHLKGADAKFEMVTSNSIQPLNQRLTGVVAS